MSEINSKKPNSEKPHNAEVSQNNLQDEQIKRTAQSKFYKKPFLSFWKKLLLAVFAIYFSFSYSYNLFGPRNYDYREYNFFQAQATILMQPVMELFGGGKISHWYDWKEIEYDSVSENLMIPVRGREEIKADHHKTLSFNNFLRSFTTDEFAKIKPKSYSKKWSLIYCTEDFMVCKESNLIHSGEIKILVDGNGWLFGRGEDGEIITLDTIRTKDYFEKGQYPELILI